MKISGSLEREWLWGFAGAKSLTFFLTLLTLLVLREGKLHD
ncbi:MAG: hypothetical protein WBL95_11285 [Microcoleus sp.]